MEFQEQCFINVLVDFRLNQIDIWVDYIALDNHMEIYICQRPMSDSGESRIGLGECRSGLGQTQIGLKFT